MADSPKNKAFLQQLERQRLNKPCNLIIDLRGKVAGECQAYTFGNLTHYLDDRAYLLAKQLLDRFDGRYTTGVYEVLLKALKSLESESTKKEVKPILFRDKDNVQVINFDSFLHRKEPRILHATPVEIHIDDVLYHATTINITTSAIRIASKRTFTLEKGSLVTVTFLDLAESSQATLLSKVHYKILSIEHDEQRTYAILVRNRADDKAVSSWLDQWSQDKNTSVQIDIENELFNLTSNYYFRIFINAMHSPLFWLANNSNSVSAFHNSPLANLTLMPLKLIDYNLDFSLLPFQQILEQQCDHLVFISKQDDTPKSFAIPRNKPQLIAPALSWHTQQENSHIFLLQTQSTTIDIDDFSQELKQLSGNDMEHTQDLIERLAAISNLVSLIDITNSCQNLPATKSSTALPKNLRWSGEMPKPTPLHHYINRKSLRFFIKTNIILDLHYGTTHSIVTTDVSETGMSLILSGFVDIKVGNHVTVNFERWQSQTDKVKLSAVPYIIRSVRFWGGSTRLGLERNFPACAESINRFFTSKVEHHKEELIENKQDISIVQEAKIFTQVLGKKLSAIPFYLGADENNIRILQAVASSQNNHAKDLSGLWQAMQSLITALSGELKTALHKNNKSIFFGLYCYVEPSGEWQIMTDSDFSTATKKSIFINRALTHDKHYFFHCSITTLKPETLERQGDLKQRLSDLRSHSPHKIKQIRDVLHSLFAIGELTDITDIISAAYQH